MFSIIFFALVYICSSEACLHAGRECSLTGGLSIGEINTEYKSLIRGTENIANVINVVTWNLEGRKENWSSKSGNVCQQLKDLKPTIFGLQSVTRDQVNDIKICLQRQYNVYTSNWRAQGKLLNPIFIKKSGIKIQVKDHGAFSLSRNPYNLDTKLTNADQTRHCTWVKISYGVEEGYVQRKENFRDKLERLLGVFTGHRDSSSNRRMSAVRRKKYRYKTVFIANTQLDDESAEVAKEQVKVLLWFLKSRVMDRRRYPVIVTGDFGFQTNSIVHDAIKRYRWLENTMRFPRQRHPDVTYTDRRGSSVRDFIFENKFKQILSAVAKEHLREGEHRPVMTTLIK